MKAKASVSKEVIQVKYKIYIIIIILSGICVSTDVDAKTYAWLVDLDGKAQKFDVGVNSITQSIDLKGYANISVSLQDVQQSVVFDAGANLVLFINDYGRVGQWVGAYNMKDMSFRKKIAIESRDPNLRLPRIVMPQGVNKFYIVWWDSVKEVNAKGGETYTTLDKTTLDKISESTNFLLNIYQPLFASANANKLYSLNIRKNELKSYDSTSLALLDTVSLISFWDTPLFGKGIEYFSNDKILFSENAKINKNDPNNFKYFIYNMLTKELSSKINVAEVGYGIIPPDGTKLIIIESSNNKVNIYDVATRQKIKYLDFSGKYTDIRILSIATISPDSSKLYMQGENIQSGVTTLIVIDLKTTYSVLAEVPNVKGSRMIFYEDQ